MSSSKMLVSRWLHCTSSANLSDIDRDGRVQCVANYAPEYDGILIRPYAPLGVWFAANYRRGKLLQSSPYPERCKDDKVAGLTCSVNQMLLANGHACEWDLFRVSIVKASKLQVKYALACVGSPEHAWFTLNAPSDKIPGNADEFVSLINKGMNWTWQAIDADDGVYVSVFFCPPRGACILRCIFDPVAQQLQKLQFPSTPTQDKSPGVLRSITYPSGNSWLLHCEAPTEYLVQRIGSIWDMVMQGFVENGLMGQDLEEIDENLRSDLKELLLDFLGLPACLAGFVADPFCLDRKTIFTVSFSLAWLWFRCRLYKQDFKPLCISEGDVSPQSKSGYYPQVMIACKSAQVIIREVFEDCLNDASALSASPNLSGQVTVESDFRRTRRSHHQRSRRKKFKDFVQCSTPCVSD